MIRSYASWRFTAACRTTSSVTGMPRLRVYAADVVWVLLRGVPRRAVVVVMAGFCCYLLLVLLVVVLLMDEPELKMLETSCFEGLLLSFVNTFSAVLLILLLLKRFLWW